VTGGRVLVACDLDGTLLYSARSLGLPDDDLLAPRLVVTEVWRGAPLTYCTREAEALLRELDLLTVLVPVTTRTRAQYARVRLFDEPGPTSGPAPGRPPRYAVVANGGHLLVDGRSDEDWAASVRARLAASCRPMAEVAEALGQATQGHRAGELRLADDLFVYVAVDPQMLPCGAFSDLSEWCATGGWRVSLQGRRLYCVPVPLTKASAVAEVAHRAGATTVLAAGDSLLDVDLLEMADLAVRPTHGELHDVGWHRPHLKVTRSSGVLAGEEIVRRMLDHVLGQAQNEASTRRPDEIVSAHDGCEGERTHV
jgi:hypothetical protein